MILVFPEFSDNLPNKGRLPEGFTRVVGQLRGQLLAACEPMDADDIRSRLRACAREHGSVVPDRIYGAVLYTSHLVLRPRWNSKKFWKYFWKSAIQRGNQFLETGLSAAGKINLRQTTKGSDPPGK